jgi:hypothetical protein
LVALVNPRSKGLPHRPVCVEKFYLSSGDLGAKSTRIVLIAKMSMMGA